MPNLEQATQLFESLCNDDAHGYSQIDRWGEYSDFDCSSAIIYAFQQAGYPVYGGRHEGYTGSMADAFAAIGFAVLPADVDLIRGDILLNVADHVALYLGDGLLGEFSQSEDGGIDGAFGGPDRRRGLYPRVLRLPLGLRAAGAGGSGVPWRQSVTLRQFR